MAIGTTAALIGSAVIGVGASAIGASSNSNAINKVTDAQTAATQQSIGLQRDIYNQNNALLDPYNQRGNVAGNYMNALLGLPSSGSSTPDYAAYVNGNPDLAAAFGQAGGQFNTPAAFGRDHWSRYGQNENRGVTPMSGGQGVSPVDAQNAFKTYQDSTGYQFRFNEGMNGLNSLNAARGTLDSGAAVKSALRYGQGIGSQEFGNYLGYLGNQQNVGMGAASAVAGVGQNYANNVSSLNQNQANAIGQGAMAKAQNTNSLLGNISTSFGLGMGALTRGYGG